MRSFYPAAFALLAADRPLAPALAHDTATEVGTDIGTLYQDETAPLYKPPGYSPYAGRNYPTRVLWGDTHLHTANSLDAAAFGNTLGPEVAYRFARGEEVVSSSGQPVKLSRPLDFLVVADHAEGLGSTEEIKKGNPTLMADPTLRRWHDLMAAGGTSASHGGDRDHPLGWHRNDAKSDAEPTARAFGLAGLHQHCRALQ